MLTKLYQVIRELALWLVIWYVILKVLVPITYFYVLGA
jgi:hypothetical protein